MTGNFDKPEAPITHIEWERAGSYFQYQDHEIFYRVSHSDKPSLLLLHGFPTCSWDFSYIWKSLEKQFNLLTVDLLGFGFSDKPVDHEYSTQEQANIIESLVRATGIKRFHILAHDYGDTVTQELIFRYSDDNTPTEYHILSACFLNGGLFPESHKHTSLQGILAGKWGSLARHFITKKTALKALDGLFGKTHKLSATEKDILWAMISHKKGNQIFHKLLQYIQERKKFRDRWVGALQSTSLPVRLINGPEDPVSGISLVNNYRQKMKNPDIVLIEGCGHFPHIEAPEHVFNAYIEFYQRVTKF